MEKLFLDTNVLVSASFWKGPSYKLLLKIIDGAASAFTTAHIIQEYRDVLRRDFELGGDEIESRMGLLLQILVIVAPECRFEVIKKDPADNRVLEGAFCAEADSIVSYDRHLLELGSFQGIKIVKPEEILRQLRHLPHKNAAGAQRTLKRMAPGLK